jgi:hypothetical protein
MLLVLLFGRRVVLDDAEGVVLGILAGGIVTDAWDGHIIDCDFKVDHSGH